MGDEDDNNNAPPFIPFSERPEWRDVVPIQQDEGPNPVVPIAYTPKFTETMNYFRAILKTEEKSARALELTTEVIKLNTAYYTAWYYRRIIMAAINYDLKKELDFTEELALSNPKNYQLWFHRRDCVEKIKDSSHELEFTARMIREDSKNYHCWAYRQWVIETFNLWDNELNYIDEVLQRDFRNNSAWNERYFVASHEGFTKELKNKEIEFAQKYIKLSPNNESPWVYLKGVIFANGDKLLNYPQIRTFATEITAKFILCAHSRSLLIDIYEEENTEDSLKTAGQLCEDLAKNLDAIREKYWIYRKTLIDKKLQK